jgi:hypothetical protein
LAGYSATGKIFTGTGAGALGWSNARAWARLAMPDGVREIVVQHNAAAALRLKYSRVAKFIGGAPSATVTPSATDERYIQGGATDAAPTYCTAFYNTGVLTGVERFQGAAIATAPYGFWIGSCQTPSAVSAWSVLMLDPVVSVPEDPDPYVWYAARYLGDGFRAGGNFGINPASAGIAPGGINTGVWAVMDTSGNLITVEPLSYTSYVNVLGAAISEGGFDVTGGNTFTWHTLRGGGYAVNPFNGKEDPLPILYARPVWWTVPRGIKGWSTLVRWTGILRTTFNDTADGYKLIAVGNVWLPWDGITPPLN